MEIAALGEVLEPNIQLMRIFTCIRQIFNVVINNIYSQINDGIYSDVIHPAGFYGTGDLFPIMQRVNKSGIGRGGSLFQ